MADLLIALVLVVGGTSAAELVRSICRRRLLTPAVGGRAVQTTDVQVS